MYSLTIRADLDRDDLSAEEWYGTIAGIAWEEYMSDRGGTTKEKYVDFLYGNGLDMRRANMIALSDIDADNTVYALAALRDTHEPLFDEDRTTFQTFIYRKDFFSEEEAGAKVVELFDMYHSDPDVTVVAKKCFRTCMNDDSVIE